MTLSNYYTVKENGFHEIIIQKSRFITYLARATTEEQAQAFISELKKAPRCEPQLFRLRHR